VNTYTKIQEYVVRRYSWTPSTCWIADAKEKCGLKVPPAWNRASKQRKNPCPPDKFPAIREAFKYFGMIK